jgi:DNA polymerase III alpha subunit
MLATFTTAPSGRRALNQRAPAPGPRLSRVPNAPGLAYAELQVTTNYSFLRGASHVEELLVAARALGLSTLAVTDHDTLAGIARAHARAAEIGIRLVVGCRLGLRDGPPVLAYPTDRAAYARLCRLLTLGRARAQEARSGGSGCDIGWQDLVAHGEGLLVILLPDAPDEDRAAFLEEIVVRRELAQNHCFFQPGYAEYEKAIPDWARRTLDEARNDPRPYRYDERALVAGETHDEG